MTLKTEHLPRFFFLLLIFLCIIEAGAQENDSVQECQRPVIGSYRFEIGTKSAHATYLSPFSYRGTNVGLSGFWTKVLPQNPQHLAMHFEGRLNFGNLLNPAHTARELDFHANVQWGLEWQKRLGNNWMVGAGGNIGIYGGLLYLPRNGNNPVAAQFATGISAQGYASKVFYIKSYPILVSDRLNLPLMSGFFCQEYGESYYEIYLGNRKGLAHFGWPGNRFGIDNLFCVTLDFGKTAMELGYRFSMQDEYANHLTTRFYNHAFVIGVVPGGIGLKSHKKSITPLY